MVESYQLDSGGSAAHFDFYRFDDPREWLDAGLREVYAGPGLKLAEWPDKVGALLPTPDLRLELQPGDDTRRTLTALAFTPRGCALLA